MDAISEFNGLPLLGKKPALDALEEVTSWLSVTWEGHAQQVIPKQMIVGKIAEAWFDPVDKGGIGMFGLNQRGKVVVGMVKFEGDKRSENPFEQHPHYYCKQMNCANPWG